MEAERMFEIYHDAYEWMLEKVDDPCVDNVRFAFRNDPAAIREYYRVKDEGCCGCFDALVSVGGQRAMIGCNYGH